MYICTYKGYIRTHILSHTCTFTPILVSEELLLFPSKANHIYWILIALLCPVPHSFLAWWSQPHNCCERMKKSCLFIQVHFLKVTTSPNCLLLLTLTIGLGTKFSLGQSESSWYLTGTEEKGFLF